MKSKHKLNLIEKIFRITVIIIAVGILSSCNSKSLDSKFNIKTYNEDIKYLTDKKALSNLDKDLLSSYILSNTGDSIILAKSYSELLTNAKASEKIRKEKEEKSQEINKQVVVGISDKYTVEVYRDEKWATELNLVGFITNNTERTISGLTVTLTFYNADDIVIFSSPWNLDNTIKAKKTTKILLSAGVIDDSNSNEGLFKLKGANLSKLKFVYQINKLMFDDGTSIELN